MAYYDADSFGSYSLDLDDLEIDDADVEEVGNDGGYGPELGNSSEG